MSQPNRKTIPTDRIMLQDFHHICLLVKDVEKAAENLAETFGIGPFTVTPYEYLPQRRRFTGSPKDTS